MRIDKTNKCGKSGALVLAHDSAVLVLIPAISKIVFAEAQRENMIKIDKNIAVGFLPWMMTVWE